MRILMIITILTTMLIAGANGQKGDLKETASKSLLTFRSLVNQQNYSSMGFKSAEEIKDATLGDPFKIYTIRLDDLKRYKEGNNPDSLLTDNENYIFPVKVKNEVRSSINISKVDNTWKAISFGSNGTIKLFSRYRTDNSFVVNIPALNLFFIGNRKDGKLMLTPVIEDEIHQFAAGKMLPAEDVLMRILPDAKEHDDLPR